MIRALIFDLDQTLVDRDSTFLNFVTKQYERFESQLSTIDQRRYIDYLVDNENNGYRSKDALYPLLCKELNLEVDPQELLEDFWQFYGDDPILFPGVPETLSQLEPNYSLGIITNGRSHGQRRKIENSGIAGHFRSIKVSEEEGIKKPDIRIFRACVAELILQPNECLFIGDNPEVDIEGAKSAGLYAIWIRNDRFPPPTDCDGSIDQVEELIELLSQESESGGSFVGNPSTR